MEDNWIEVGMRLPEDGEDILVYAPWLGCARVAMLWEGEYESEGGNILPDITHWQPIPEPPLDSPLHSRR